MKTQSIQRIIYLIICSIFYLQDPTKEQTSRISFKIRYLVQKCRFIKVQNKYSLQPRKEKQVWVPKLVHNILDEEKQMPRKRASQLKQSEEASGEIFSDSCSGN